MPNGNPANAKIGRRRPRLTIGELTNLHDGILVSGIRPTSRVLEPFFEIARTAPFCDHRQSPGNSGKEATSSLAQSQTV